jgi:anti-sigma factor RsiW
VPANDLTCQELVELVTMYLEAALSPADRDRFEAHLVRCAGCRAYLQQMRQTIRLAGTLSENDLSDEARETLLGAFRSWKRGQSALPASDLGQPPGG